MKRLLILLVLLPLLVGITSVRADDEITVVETWEENVTPNALCKSGTHKISFQQNGVEKAWIKLTMTNACWSACGIKLDNATHSKWAASGWSVTWGASSLGGRSCKYENFSRYSNATINAPPGISDYLARHESALKLLEPQDLNWSWWKTPVIIR